MNENNELQTKIEPLSLFFRSSKYIFTDNNINANPREYEIPYYQREYSWSKKECKVLWDDIIHSLNKERAEDKFHFLGSVFLQKFRNNVDDNSYLVIDGQQRIITFSILFKAIDIIIDQNIICLKNSEKLKEIKNYIQRYSYSGLNSFIPAWNLIKFQNKNEIKGMENVLKLDLEKLSKEKKQQKDSNFYSNLSSFVQWINDEINNKYGGDPTPFIEKLLNTFNYMKFNVVFISSSLNGQVIFENLNSKGLALRTSDKIHNYLSLEYILEKDDAQGFSEELKEMWNDLEDKALNDFINLFCSYKRENYINSSNIYNTFIQLYKNEYKHKNRSDKPHKDIFNDIKKYLKWYKSLYLKNTDEYEFYWLSLLRSKFVNIFNFWIQDWVDEMHGKKTEKFINEERNKFLIQIEKYFVYQKLVGNNIRNFNKHILTILKSLSTVYNNSNLKPSKMIEEILKKIDSSNNNRYPTTQEAEEAFLRLKYDGSNKNKDFIKFILMSISFRKSIDEMDKDYSKWSIEHILPISVTQSDKDGVNSKNWINDIKKWDSSIKSEDDVKKKYSEFYCSFGNLALLRLKTNIELQNKSFSEKKKILSEKSNSELKNYFTNIEKWDDEEIKRRSSHMKDKFFQFYEGENYLKQKNEALPKEENLNNKKQKQEFVYQICIKLIFDFLNKYKDLLKTDNDIFEFVKIIRKKTKSGKDILMETHLVDENNKKYNKKYSKKVIIELSNKKYYITNQWCGTDIPIIENNIKSLENYIQNKNNKA